MERTKQQLVSNNKQERLNDWFRWITGAKRMNSEQENNPTVTKIVLDDNYFGAGVVMWGPQWDQTSDQRMQSSVGDFLLTSRTGCKAN